MSSKKDSSRFLFRMFCAALGVVAVTVLFYGYHFTSLSDDHKAWAEFGSFFGGVVTPILAFFSFIALLYTIHIQKRELELTREELTLSRAEIQRSASTMEAQEKNMRFQQFENTFFSMLQMLNSLYSKVHRDLTLLETEVTQVKPDLVGLSISALRSDYANGHYFKLISRIFEHIQSNGSLIDRNNYYRTLQSVLPERVFIIYCAKLVGIGEVNTFAVQLRSSGFCHDAIKFEHEHLRKLYKEFLTMVDKTIANQ